MSNLIKFIADYKTDRDVFPRNGLFEYRTKYETIVDDEFMFMFVIDFNEKTYTVPGNTVVEIEKVINKDYTEEQWRDFITKDALVTDGDYVKAWKETFGIILNEGIDQCDYNGRWRELQKEIRAKYGDAGGFIES